MRDGERRRKRNLKKRGEEEEGRVEGKEKRKKKGKETLSLSFFPLFTFYSHSRSTHLCS